MQNRDILKKLLSLSDEELDTQAVMCVVTGECDCTFSHREIVDVGLDYFAGGKRAVVFTG